MRSWIALLVEPTMYFGVGFLIAALLSLMFVPVINRRAKRLTARRIDELEPNSVQEMRAEKDLLRAEFALSTQRLEGTIDRMRAKAAAQLADLGRHSQAVNTLKVALAERTRTIYALEAREKLLREQLHATEQEQAAKAQSLEEAERMLLDKELELGQLTADLSDTSASAEQQRVELAAARAEVDVLRSDVDAIGRETEELNIQLLRQRQTTERASRELQDERGNVENLGRRVADLEIELTSQRLDAEALNKATADRLGAQGRIMAEREFECARLHIALDAARRIEGGLRAELTELEARHASELSALCSDKAALEAQVQQLQHERLHLQQELASLRIVTERSEAADRIDSALMRERLDEVAGQVERLTRALQADPAAPAAPLNGEIGIPIEAFKNGAATNGAAGMPDVDDLFADRNDHESTARAPMHN